MSDDTKRWTTSDADPVGDPSRLPYAVRDGDGDRRADFLVSHDAENYARERNRQAGVTTEVGDAFGEVERAKRGRLLDLRALLDCADAVPQYDREALQGLGVESDPADDPETARDEAEERLYEFPLAVEKTVTFEVVIGTGGPDDRFLFECNVYEDEGRRSYEVDRVLYRYSWSNSAERVLSGDERETAEAFARRVVPELSEAF